jgi:biotin carboxyl carrier protein
MIPTLSVLVGTPRRGLAERVFVELGAPQPGYFIPAVRHGDLVTTGSVVGRLVVLGRSFALIAARIRGLASNTLELDPIRTDLDEPRAVGYGQRLFALQINVAAELGGGGDVPSAATAEPRHDAGLVFRAPTAGRYYGRSSPDKPPFVTVGAELTAGATVCLLEVMKTFNRVTYTGAPARVTQLLVAEGADVNAADPLLALEPV